MSFLVCPNSSGVWLRTAFRGVSCRAATVTTTYTTQPFSPARWISSRISRNPQALPVKSTSRCRSPATFAPAYPYVTRRTLFDKTTRNYEDIPKDYRDQVGLPFRKTDLTDAEITKVFGKGINAKRANHLLRILHGRRVAGTLDDPVFAVHTAHFTQSQIAAALDYLRKSIPVDEVLNAGLRAEDELAQLEQEAKQAGQTKKAKQEKPASTYKPDPVYGHSAFDEMRAKNIAKRKAKELYEKEERLAAEARGEVVAGPLAKVRTEERQIQNPKIKEYYNDAQSDLTEPPEMKPWERILPSVTVVALILGLLASVAMVYEEPEARYRIFPQISTAEATMGAIVAINILVCAAWHSPPMWKFLNRYMIFCVATVRPITMFTAPFSHQKFGHLALNMVSAWFIGVQLHEELGRANFLALYLGCGALGFTGSLITYTLRGWLTITSLGASGAVLGLCSAYFWEHRNDGFKFFGLPDNGVHGIVFLAMLGAVQLGFFGYTVKSKIDLASHLSGLLAGILGIEFLNRNRPPREKQVFNWAPRASQPERLQVEATTIEVEERK